MKLIFLQLDSTEEAIARVAHRVSRFLPDLQRDLSLVYQAEHWDEVRLATWLCCNLPEDRLTHGVKRAFVAAWLGDVRRRDGFTLARVKLQKFLIRDLIEARIRELRRQAVKESFQQTLFGEDAANRVAVGDRISYVSCQARARSQGPSSSLSTRGPTAGRTRGITA